MQNVIKTNTSKNEFESRFKELVIPVKFSLKYWEKSAFIGKIDKNRFYFYWKEAFVRNSFRTVIRGELIETQEGCNISFKYDKFILIKLFTILTSSAVILFGCILLMDLQFIGLIPIVIGLLLIMLIKLKTKKSKEILYKQLLKIANTIVVKI